MPTLPIELAELLRDSEGMPVSVIDPKTGMEFVIVPAADYARLANSLTHAELTHNEQDYLLRQAGRLAGWDDSEMDVYNELDPRKTA